ncbi:hypothetical protein GLOIN_2v1480580 [Rhizophagus irregularis DAOM 181602=DAOM 197198]|nr:hypothetical protein GLOIN_2v1480580 [Rhizophagus irregularis DAOM 181602=DAOM 197198]
MTHLMDCILLLMLKLARRMLLIRKRSKFIGLESSNYKGPFETKDFSETSEYSSSGHDFKWSSNTVKYFNSKFAITTCTNEDKQMEIIHVIKITVQVSAEDREMIIRCLKLNALESDATEICLSQESDGSLSIHKIISDHLKIDSDSIEDTVKGLTFFVEKVLEEQKIEWEDAYEKADSEEYLIQQGIVVHNELSKKITVDHDTNKTICGMFGSTADDECFNEIINSQTNNGNFKCRELISGPFKIKLSEKNIDSLKNYAEKLCLRRLENSVWITSLIIVYFEIVLAKYKSDSKWSSAYNSAKNLVQQSVRNHKYEKELHDACEKYLLRLGYNYLTKKFILLKNLKNKKYHRENLL